MNNLMRFDISNIARTLVHTAKYFNVSLEEAWEDWMPFVMTEKVSFKEVMQYLERKQYVAQ